MGVWINFCLRGDKVNVVEPIRSVDLIRDISLFLKTKSERNYIMFLLGIYSGLRISDILKLKVKDVKNKNSISLREQKTDKQRIFVINPYLKKELKKYIDDNHLPSDQYLIKRQGKRNASISRVRAYEILREAAQYFRIDNIGTHTMRKTFGYHFYLQTKDVVTLQKIFNHAHPVMTLRYIGIEQDEINKKVKDFKLL